jgi:outer membrane protein TolC
MIRALDSNIASSETDINIAQQAYKPEFGIEVMYAYRHGDNMKGEPASDLVSAYLTVDLPLFTDNRQDRSLNAAKYQSIAHRSNKDLVLSQMKARVESAVTTRINLDERLLRFNQVLLPQAKARTEAVQRGYENNTARFMDYISAANEALMLELERWRVVSDLNQANNQIAYLLDRYDIDFETIALPMVSTK